MENLLYNDIERVLITEKELADKVKELGEAISKDYRDEKVLMVCILRGSIVFFSDLIRSINADIVIDTMSVSSYGAGSATTGKVRIIKDLDSDIMNMNVIIVEDIIDSGNTMNNLTNMLSTRKPKSLKIVSLLDKPSRREVEIEGDYVGFTIPDEFVVGYGLDYAERYRGLKDICVLAPRIYKK